MGRPRKPNKLEQINVMLEPKEIKEIERLAKKIGISRGQFMRNLVRNGLADARLFDQSGLLAAVCSGYKAIKSLRKKLDFNGAVTDEVT